MRVNISELLYACPEGFGDVACAPAAGFDGTVKERIKARVLNRITADKAHRSYKIRRTLRTAVLIAAAMLLFSATAYAVSSLFQMHMDTVSEGEIVSGTWTWRDKEGNAADVQTWSYEDAGVVFTFEGESPRYRCHFKPGWLPGESGDTGSWYQYLVDDGDGEGNHIPYCISIYYAQPGFWLVLNGDCELVGQEQWNGFAVTEIVSEWTSDPHRDLIENYVLLFSEEGGYMIVVGGTSEMETLKRIAFSLEVDTTDVPFEPTPDMTIGTINIGRG